MKTLSDPGRAPKACDGPWRGSLDCGVILFGRAGLVKHATRNARRWLRAYFGRQSGASIRLPEALRAEVDGRRRRAGTDRGRPSMWAFSAGQRGRRLLVRLVPDRRPRFLLLEEERKVHPAAGLATFRLTRREAEVLAWVTEGKTNPEIAKILNISSKTVKKHLEHVYSKLGVETRTAAAARVLAKATVAGARSAVTKGD